jgi:transcriptional regulator with XRE-family HTH domain
MLDVEDIAIIVRDRRKARSLTQADLAKRTGVSRSRIAGLETNRLPEIGLKTVLRLLAALDLDLEVVPNRGVRPTLDDLRRERER